MATAVKIVTLPGGRSVSLGEYVRSIRVVKTMSPDRTVWGWTWYPVEARDVLRDFRAGVDDRVNIRGGLVIREASEARVHRRLRARVKCDCRWCGRELPAYQPAHARFCNESCRRSFNT